jgi:hypothetical protein
MIPITKILQASEADVPFQDAFKPATSGFRVSPKAIIKNPPIVYPKHTAQDALV